MFTTLVAQKAPAGTRRSKATLRKREDLIEKCGIAVGKLRRYSGFAREAFICGEDNTAATPVPGHCNHSLREQNGLAPLQDPQVGKPIHVSEQFPLLRGNRGLPQFSSRKQPAD